MPVPTPTHVFRITHHRNLPWILDNGLHCRNSANQDPNFINIGNRELIDKRAHRVVPIAPGGFLNDYVPFYFCKHSVMLLNIHTGRVPGVKVPQDEVVYLVSTIERLVALELPFLFTNRHAYVESASYLNDTAQLGQLDWPLIQGRDFRRDPNDLDKLERRAAECLVHQRVPVDALIGIACCDQARVNYINGEAQQRGLALQAKLCRTWFF